LPKINKSIEDGTIKKNEKLLKAIDHAKKNKSKLHLMGLVSNGGVHSHHDHLYALLEMCKERGVGEVYIHAFLDGRDTAKDGAKEFIKSLQAKLAEMKFGQIASLSGRYYAMDRDNNWEREEKAYRAIALGDSPAKFDDRSRRLKLHTAIRFLMRNLFRR
jgi:2,3-bisphosphoglycerate-independent phosphoglycerate mutase